MDPVTDMVRVLERAFPDGLDEEAYPAVLATLYDDMSDEQLSRTVAHFTGRNRHDVWNDIARVIADRLVMPERRAETETRLRAAGWEPDPDPE